MNTELCTMRIWDLHFKWTPNDNRDLFYFSFKSIRLVRDEKFVWLTGLTGFRTSNLQLGNQTSWLLHHQDTHEWYLFSNEDQVARAERHLTRDWTAWVRPRVEKRFFFTPSCLVWLWGPLASCKMNTRALRGPSIGLVIPPLPLRSSVVTLIVRLLFRYPPSTFMACNVDASSSLCLAYLVGRLHTVIVYKISKVSE